MIRLIVSDLDGTLLNGKKELSPRFFLLWEQLQERGVIFAAASGRPLSVLRALFAPAGGKIALIGHNGGAVECGGKLLHAGGFGKDGAARVAAACADIPTAHLLADREDGLFLLDEHPGFLQVCSRYFAQYSPMPAEALFCGEQRFYRMAVWDSGDAAKTCARMAGALQAEFDLMLSGDGWIDIMKKGEGKGRCLSVLQEALGVTEEETMGFGDYLNDAAFLQRCGQSYAMKNAHRALKERCRFVTERTNEEEGVVFEICRRLGICLSSK